MDQTLGDFIKALRNADVRVSSTEVVDAHQVIDLVGYSSRSMLKNALALVLPKTADEKAIYDYTFDRFFKFDELDEMDMADKNQAAGEAGRDPEAGENAGQEGGGQGEGGGGGGQNNMAEAGAGGEGAPGSEDTHEQGEMRERLSALSQMVLSGDRAGLSVAMAEAGEAVGLRNIFIFTQKGLYSRRILEHMGLKALNNDITDLRKRDNANAHELAERLRKGREYLLSQVRDYVEQQFLLHADVDGSHLREDILSKSRLTNIERRDYRMVQEMVRKMAKRLIAIHSRRRKVYDRGALDIRKTMAKNHAYDGVPFDIRWKSVKIDRPKVVAICDVSGSVAKVAHFMLMFLYSLNEVMPKVRSFAFSARMGEVTDLFKDSDVETAMSKTLAEWGQGSTDYGRSLQDFAELALNDIDSRTTVIMLGDARSNYGDPGSEIMKKIYDRSKWVMWLNPEEKNTWNYADSVMRKFQPYCHQVQVCNSLTHLERIVSMVLRSSA
ncbi:MAG: VWA domain-containing protein [Alphaproteobacteria bacterium]|nr:VWA domain-containing protein [Alphaproteobacteria bacterium]